jgi:hypothetical protein
MTNNRVELNLDELNEVNGGTNLENVKQRKKASSTVMGGVAPKGSSLVKKGGSVAAAKLGSVDISSSPEVKDVDPFDKPTFI